MLAGNLGISVTHDRVPDFDGATTFEYIYPNGSSAIQSICLYLYSEDPYSEKERESSPNNSKSASGSVSTSNSICLSFRICGDYRLYQFRSAGRGYRTSNLASVILCSISNRWSNACGLIIATVRVELTSTEEATTSLLPISCSDIEKTDSRVKRDGRNIVTEEIEPISGERKLMKRKERRGWWCVVNANDSASNQKTV